jgi:hypothetical protein
MTKTQPGRDEIRLSELALKSYNEGRGITPPSQDRAREGTLEIIRKWKFFWMNQKQNSEEDFQNYFNRACGIDSNMIHHLADLIDANPQTHIEKSAEFRGDDGDVSKNGEFFAVKSSKSAELQDRIQALEKQLKEAKKEDEKMVARLHRQSGVMADLENENAELKAELKILKNPSDGRCMEIGALRTQVDELKAKLDATHAIAPVSAAELAKNELVRSLLIEFKKENEPLSNSEIYGPWEPFRKVIEGLP